MKFFSMKKSVLTLTLGTGESLVVAPKSTFELSPSQSRCGDVKRGIAKGLIKALPEKKEEEKVTFVFEDDANFLDIDENKPSNKWTKKSLIDYAIDNGFDVSGMTKNQILEVLTTTEEVDHG